MNQKHKQLVEKVRRELKGANPDLIAQSSELAMRIREANKSLAPCRDCAGDASISFIRPEKSAILRLEVGCSCTTLWKPVFGSAWESRALIALLAKRWRLSQSE